MNFPLCASWALAALLLSGRAPAAPPLAPLAYQELFSGANWPDRAVVDDPARTTTVTRKPLAPNANGFYWNAAHAPIGIAVGGRRIPAWQLAGGVAPPPVTPRDGVYQGAWTPPPKRSPSSPTAAPSCA